MKKVIGVLIMIISFLVLLTNIRAQTVNTPPNSNFRKPLEPIAYSAEATSETIQMLVDGNKIKRSTKEIIYSDGKGRVRRETELSPSSGKIQKFINIRDSVAGFEYYLNPITKTAFRTPIKKYSAADNQKITPLVGYSSKSESLGTKIIEGFETTGRRSITTIAAGTVGNEQPLEMISESWYSSELAASIMSNRKDPQSGNVTYQMKNIKREMPDASLFAIPADYKTIEQDSLSDRFFLVDAPK